MLVVPDTQKQSAAETSLEPTETLCVRDSLQLLRFIKHARALDDNIRLRLNESGPAKCASLVEKVVVPNWDHRIALLTYCQQATRSAVPVDEEVAKFQQLDDEQKNEMLRIDPYGYKGLLRRQLDYEQQVRGVRWMYDRELEVDLVVRQRTAAVLKDMCGYEVDESYIKKHEK